MSIADRIDKRIQKVLEERGRYKDAPQRREAVLVALTDANPERRKQAIRAVRVDDPDQATDHLLNVIKNDSDPHCATLAIEELYHLSPTKAAYERILADRQRREQAKTPAPTPEKKEQPKEKKNEPKCRATREQIIAVYRESLLVVLQQEIDRLNGVKPTPQATVLKSEQEQRLADCATAMTSTTWLNPYVAKLRALGPHYKGGCVYPFQVRPKPRINDNGVETLTEEANARAKPVWREQDERTESEKMDELIADAESRGR